MRSLFFFIIENKCRRSRRRTLRFHLLVSFLPENPLPVKELFVGDAISSAPCRFWHSTCKAFIDDSCPLFTANFMCDLIHNITSWGYYLIGKRECHGTYGLPCTSIICVIILLKDGHCHEIELSYKGIKKTTVINCSLIISSEQGIYKKIPCFNTFYRVQ